MVAKTKVIIFGGGLSGLVAAHTLSRGGVEHTLIEKSPRLGGGNRCYRDSKGRIFDSGYHALDYNRSECATDFFIDALRGEYHRFTLQRGIAVGGEVFGYALPPEEWPQSLQPILGDVGERNDIENPVTRDKLDRVYGKAFTDFVYDRVLGSYPTLLRALEEGGDLPEQMRLIYPWFFPAIAKAGRSRSGESESYHDAMREKGGQQVLYPKQGGFENFLLSLARDVEQGNGTILVGESEIDVVFEKTGNRIEKVATSKGELVADYYLWCAPVPLALRMLGEDIGLKSSQNLMLGNFSFENDIGSKYHEILVGDSDHLINRISYPGKVSQSEDRTLQVEFLCPAGGEFDKTPEQWRSLWETSLKSLGLITDENVIEEFSFHCEMRGFVVAEKYDDLIDRCREIYTNLNTNLRIPFLSLGPENINRLVPGVISYLKNEVL